MRLQLQLRRVTQAPTPREKRARESAHPNFSLLPVSCCCLPLAELNQKPEVTEVIGVVPTGQLLGPQQEGERQRVDLGGGAMGRVSRERGFLSWGTKVG